MNFTVETFEEAMRLSEEQDVEANNDNEWNDEAHSTNYDDINPTKSIHRVTRATLQTKQMYL